MKHFWLLIFVLHSLLSFAQQTDVVDFKRAEALVLFNQIEVDNTFFNSYEISFEILKHTDSVYIDAVGMRIQNVALNGKSVDYKNDGKKLIIYHDFKPSDDYRLNFIFFATPKKAMYFVGWDSSARNQIWTQGQGKYTSHWLPSIDDMNDKIEFDITYAAPKAYQVIANGQLIAKNESANYNLWQYDMQQPMSSYLVAVVMGKYAKDVEISKSGIPLEMYYYPEDTSKVEPTYRYTKRMFDFLEDEIGVPYPWQNYKQIPVHDFLYAGMENTGTTIFSDDFMIDAASFDDKNYVNVNAHELAHQSFGDLVTETSGEHHWLQEGFATYYALLAEREVFGVNYYYWQLHEYFEELAAQELAGNGTALLNPKSSSTTFYKKGAWVLHALKETIGEVAFKKAVKSYLLKHQFKNVETKDFIKQVEKASGKDLSDFVELWLERDVLPKEQMLASLKRSPFMQEYFMVDCEVETSKCNEYLSLGISEKALEKVIRQSPERVTSETFGLTPKVRQAIAKHLKKIPSNLQSDYETLLEDASYLTKELALVNLWVNFPEKRKDYLKKTRFVMGFNTRNVRLLWLTLSLITEGVDDAEKDIYYKELVDYTNPEYNFEVRLSAFNYLQNIKAFNAQALENLQNATKHHNWQLQKFSKNLLKQLAQNPELKPQIEQLQGN